MLYELAYRSPLTALMERAASILFLQGASSPSPAAKESAPAAPYYPPGLSGWDPEVGDQEPIKAKHCWTGNYIATFLVTFAPSKETQSVLRKGMLLDQELIKDGCYPVVLGFGTFENARSSRHPFLGLNYNEFLAAVPRVFMPDSKYRYQGPYLYPYKLYLNRLLPTIFGRLSGYPKYWERVTLTHAAGPPHTYLFRVGKLLTGKSIMELTFTVSPGFDRVRHFPRFSQISRLLIPNIVASGLFNIPLRTCFDLDVANAVAWNVPTATLRIDDRSLFPVSPGNHTWQGIQQEVYGAVRLYLPWRLTSVDDPKLELPWAMAQAVEPRDDNQQDVSAAS
jgi:hypothetical protein